MTPQERVERALGGSHADRVPFTMYEGKVIPCRAERDMRNRGMCVVDRRGVFTSHTPNVKRRQAITFDNGSQRTTTWLETPVGTLRTVSQPAGFTSWTHEQLFKTPEDYKALRFLIQDEQFAPDYGPFAEAQDAWGGDAICRAGLGYEPLQALIYSYMGVETFCIEWMENRDEVLTCYQAIVEKRRLVYPLVADSPAGHANYGGNVTPQIISPQNFHAYYLPHYLEAAEVMHKKGKLIGCHFDADCRLLSKEIAATGLDYIEAFTPVPDTDMTLAEARTAWPDKVIWLNYPSSVHLSPDAKVQTTMIHMLEELTSIDGIIVGITEDMPEGRWLDSCRAIMDGLDEHARRHPEMYS